MDKKQIEMNFKRDEFHQLRNDDKDFAEQYDDTEKDFQEWYEEQGKLS